MLAIIKPTTPSFQSVAPPSNLSPIPSDEALLQPPPARGLNRRSSATRDWTALPQDILFTIFLKLEPQEILRGADRACTAWRCVAVGDPMLWRHLDMGTVALSRCWWRTAVRHGTGLCESFSARCCRNATLQFLVQRAPFLKRLRLLDANISSEALNEVI
ncbi:unnamed protein product [Urochloa humidicola]